MLLQGRINTHPLLINPLYECFQLKRDKNGVHYIILPRNWLKQGFKFTRGSWGTVEGTTGGSFIENRFYSDKGKVLKIGILGWEG